MAEEITGWRNADPVSIVVNLENQLVLLREHGISEDSFQELKDKEYVHALHKAIRKVQASMEPHLGEKEIRQLCAGVLLERTLDKAKTLLKVRTARTMMPLLRLNKSFIKWGLASSFCFMGIAGYISVSSRFGGNGQGGVHQYIAMAIGAALPLLAGLATAIQWRTVFPKIKRMLEESHLGPIPPDLIPLDLNVMEGALIQSLHNLGFDPAQVKTALEAQVQELEARLNGNADEAQPFMNANGQAAPSSKRADKPPEKIAF